MVRWYKKFKGDLEDLWKKGNVKICVRMFSGKPNTGHMFAVFNNINDFHVYYSSLSEKYHHEFIDGSRPQKLRFDIDHKEFSSGQRIFDDLLDNLIGFFKTMNITLKPGKDIFVTNSHASDKSKYSCHVIVRGYIVSNFREAKYVYNQVVGGMRDDYSRPLTEIVDSSIYGTKKWFRILGSAKKYNDLRLKKIPSKFKYNGKVYEHKRYDDIDMNYFYLRETMITHTPHHRSLPIEIPEEDYINREIPAHIFTHADKVNALYPGVFGMPKFTKSAIILPRLIPSLCLVCNVVHDSMFSSVYMNGEELCLYCNRSHIHVNNSEARIILYTPYEECIQDLDCLEEDNKDEPKPIIINKKERANTQAAVVARSLVKRQKQRPRVGITRIGNILSAAPQNKRISKGVSRRSMNI